MTIKSDIVFTNNAGEEMDLLMQEARFTSVLNELNANTGIPQGLKEDLRQMVIVLADLFGTDLPAVDDDPLEVIRTASRDINLSKLLRERGLFRLYRLLQTENIVIDEETGRASKMPSYRTLIDPETGVPFARREDFIGWFCREAHVARAIVFMRMSTIDKLLGLGMTLEEAFRTILPKPYAIRETLNEVGIWDKGKLVGVEPVIAARLASRMLPDKAAAVQEIAAKMETADNKEKHELSNEMAALVAPALVGLVQEVAKHESVRDAMDFVRHDIAIKPELRYSWDFDNDCLEVEYVKKGYDAQGTEYIVEVMHIPFIPETELLPQEVRKDLLTRLPVVNREMLGA